jgi:capsular exopolysaccharide synthesis family protein
MNDQPKVEVARPATNFHRPASVHPYYDDLFRRIQAVSGVQSEVPLSLGVTSCLPGEGVSTVAANLALAATRVSRGPVLLVDANMARPAVARSFHVAQGKGLSEVLLGKQPIFESVVDSGVQNLSLVLRGSASRQAQPAFSHASIAELIDALKHVFGVIVFDLQPASERTTCFSLGPHLDGVLLVLEADRVHREMVAETQRELQDMQMKLLGIVLNKYGRDGAAGSRVGLSTRPHPAAAPRDQILPR